MDAAPLLYLMRHGETEFNLKRIVQGRCNSPLTTRGRAQARQAARWLKEAGAAPARLASSPIGRASATLDIVIEELPQLNGLPRTAESGLMERSYGSFEGGPLDALPITPWLPHDVLVPYGGDPEDEARARIVDTLTDLMERAEGGDVLAVSHGAIINLFKLTMAEHARCDQDVPLSNCCVLVFAYDQAARTFSNIRIENPAA